jgi:hypothetical protein
MEQSINGLRYPLKCTTAESGRHGVRADKVTATCGGPAGGTAGTGC